MTLVHNCNARHLRIAPEETLEARDCSYMRRACTALESFSAHGECPMHVTDNAALNCHLSHSAGSLMQPTPSTCVKTLFCCPLTNF